MNKRLATHNDNTEIRKLLELMRIESRYKAFPLNDGKLKAFVAYLIKSESSLVVLIEDPEIVGLFIANIDEMYFSDCTTASDFIFYVSPEHRKKGIGGQLIEHYFDWAKEMKADDISLSTSTGISGKAISVIADKYGMTKKGDLYGRVENVRNT